VVLVVLPHALTSDGITSSRDEQPASRDTDLKGAGYIEEAAMLSRSIIAWGLSSLRRIAQLMARRAETLHGEVASDLSSAVSTKHN
jgi:hypothetical protein